MSWLLPPQGLGTKTIKGFASRMLDLNTNNGILVYKQNVSAIARQLLQVTHFFLSLV